jgi:hypothetical protein
MARREEIAARAARVIVLTVLIVWTAGLRPVAAAGVQDEVAFSRTPDRPGLPLRTPREATPSRTDLDDRVVDRPVLAVDVDETLCVTDYNSLIWGIGSDDTTPLPGSAAALRQLAGTYDVVYVTARSRSLAGKTSRWLEAHGFPRGRLVTSPTLGDFIFQSNFKQQVLRKLRIEYPNMVVGIGDKVKDGEAYRSNRMVSVIVNPWRGHRYHANDIVLRDWAAVAAFFEANRPVLSDPQQLNEALRRGGVGLDASRTRLLVSGQS